LVKKFAWVDRSGDHSARLTVSNPIVYAKRDRGQYAKRAVKKSFPRRLFPKSAKYRLIDEIVARKSASNLTNPCPPKRFPLNTNDPEDPTCPIRSHREKIPGPSVFPRRWGIPCRNGCRR
jgi:hypothetical protein